MHENYLSDSGFYGELEESPRTFFTMTPNIIYRMRDAGIISNTDVIVYQTLREIAGERGRCWMGVRALSKKCHLDTKTITKCKKSLSKPFDFLGGKPLIAVRKGDKKKEEADTVLILNIWRENDIYFQKISTCGKRHYTHEGNDPTQEDSFKEDKQQASKGAKAPAAAPLAKTNLAKANPSLPKPKKEVAKPKEPKIYECLKGNADILEKEMIWITSKYSEEEVKNALEWVKNRLDRITTTYIAILKWCLKIRPWEEESKPIKKKNPLVTPPTAEEINRAYANRYDRMREDKWFISTSHSYVIIANRYDADKRFEYAYSDSRFKKDFLYKLEELNFEILEQ